MSTFKKIYDEYEQTFRQQLLDKLYKLSPYDFEHFARKLLDAYGFVEVEVTPFPYPIFATETSVDYYLPGKQFLQRFLQLWNNLRH